MNILVTGGAGYIGSHTVVELVAAGHTVQIVDNLSNSSRIVVQRIKEITGTSIPLHVFDVQDKAKLDKLFSQQSFDAVLHFAGLKAVGESTKDPLRYYHVNIDAALILLEVMQRRAVRKLIFSSSATVYGSVPYPYVETQDTGQGISSPYGQTKYIVEQIIKDTAKTNLANNFTILRYFNPIGAHPSGLIGEHPQSIPNNLMPFITQVATGIRSELSIFGNNYDTRDGTCVRDYIHVVDLARGHVAALEHSIFGTSIYNLGTGKGTSVLELVRAFEKASGVTVPYVFTARRPGDLAEYFANPKKATHELDWRTLKTIDDACTDAWRWQSNNPHGYE
jgi:UDP-glucose 4-epimerase